MYNATLGEASHRHGLLKPLGAWQITRTIANKTLRGGVFQRLSQEAGFTPAAIMTFARARKNKTSWQDRLGFHMTQRIAEQVFATMAPCSSANVLTRVS
ncbi:MAG: hypothetical protein ACYDEV_16750 [Acidiferrobacter sp.]